MELFYSGSDEGLVTNKNKYVVNSVNDENITLKISDGAVVTVYNTDLAGNYLITYDNTLGFINGEYTNGLSFSDCKDESTGLNYSYVQTGDMFKIEGDITVTGTTEGLVDTYNVAETLDGSSLYFFTQIGNNDNINYFTICDDYNASEGSAPFIKNKKYINQKIETNNSEASIYSGLVSYSVRVLEENNLPSTITNSDNYVAKQGGVYAKNGMDVGGVTYAFDSDTEVLFDTYKVNNKNYLIVHSKIETEVNENNLGGNNNNITKNIDYVQKINYSIGSCWDTNYDYQYKNGISWFNFTYENNALLPHSKNYFDSQDISNGNISFNNINNVYPNVFNIQDDGDLSIYNSITNNDTEQPGTNINIINESKFRKIESNFSGTEDPTENLTFEGINNIF